MDYKTYLFEDYVKKKGVTVSYVNKLIREKIFLKLQLPSFVEIDGQKIFSGEKVGISVPLYYQLQENNVELNRALTHAKIASNGDEELENAFFKIIVKDGDARKTYDRKFGKKHPKYQAYIKGLNVLLDLIHQEAVDLLAESRAFLKEVEESLNS